MKVALLAYGLDCPDYNIQVGKELGSFLHKYNVIPCAGGFQGTFEAIFKNNLEQGGENLLLIEAKREKDAPKALFSTIETFQDTDQKHNALVNNCAGAFVIGGGQGSALLIDKMLLKNRPVIAFKGTQGQADNNSDPRIYRDFDTVEEGVKLLIRLTQKL
ncbi:MAG: hypothetical protein CL843_17990 [Crocinitomicaceae bacterium]|nr:hypothetical protein [Crocinitomicaceae bacterium]|tara:strand:+ start:93 stop:572 length:480 start_codon:yes stop_codon:yes gene_type:complete